MEQLLIAFVQRVGWAQELLKETWDERKDPSATEGAVLLSVPSSVTEGFQRASGKPFSAPVGVCPLPPGGD